MMAYPDTQFPACRSCLYMELSGWANVTANNRHMAGPRGKCMCRHPDAVKTFREVCPRSPRLPAFIGFTAPGGNAPQIKTSPRWCPFRYNSFDKREEKTS